MYKNELVKIYDDWQSLKTMDVFTKVINDENIYSFSRLGGVDFEIAKESFINQNYLNDESVYKRELYRANNFPGYFDFENKKENFISYAQKMITYFKDIDSATYAGKSLRDEIGITACSENTRKFLNYILPNKTIINGGFLGGVMPFLNSFKTWGEGKKILIISPLSKSLQFQYQRRDKIMKNYTYPNFELLTYNTNMTWQHPNDTKEKLELTTNNWHEECDRLGTEISKLDFDIAFLSCGSYAMYLGYFIKNSLHKKSIYIGGILNILFSIYGGRYNLPDYLDFHNPGYMIDPFENKDVKKITAGREYKSEAVNAYFGYQTLGEKL